MIHDLHRQGLSIQEIARRTRHDRKTIGWQPLVTLEARLAATGAAWR